MLKENSLFRNQFIASTEEINSLDGWSKIIMGKYFSYFHPSLKTSFTKNSTSELLLIGNAFDYINPEKSNKQIADKLNNTSECFLNLIKSKYFFSLSGTYLIFYYSLIDDSLFVVGDASMQKELFYFKNDKGIVSLGATDKIINEFFIISHDDDIKSNAFFNSKAFQKRQVFICDSTNYKGLFRLKPNYYLNLKDETLTRFFPFEKINPVTLNEAVKNVSFILKNYIKAAASRDKIMIPVTAGWDTRLLLAASKEVRNEVIYYVLQTNTAGPEHYDIRIPQKLMKSLKLPLDIVNYEKKIDDYFKQIIENSLTFYRIECFEYIINYFYKKYPTNIILNGNVSEIARLYFNEVFNLNPEKIALIQKYPYLEYAVDKFDKWLNKNKYEFEKYGYRVLDMLYWEENCANWVAKSKTEFNTFGIEVFSPFNSRILLINLLGLPKKYRHQQNPVVYKKIIEHLWPEVLQYPINPSPKKNAIRITQYLGIFPIFRNMKLWWNLIHKK